MVRFVIGRAGSGKTRRCFDSIVAAVRAEPLGRPIFWVVPKQATFEAERRLTCESGLGAFARVRVVSFERLGEEVLAECGGVATAEVDALGRQIILGHLLRQHESQLTHFKSVARQPGLVQKLDAAFTEIERAGKTADDLAALQREMADTTPADDVGARTLADKLRDLHLIYTAYAAYLGQERLDPHRRLQQVLQRIEHCSSLRGAIVYVDGFIEFTEYERQVMAALGKVCEDVEVTMLMDPASPLAADANLLPDELSVFHRTEMTYRRLWWTFEKVGVPRGTMVRLKDITRFPDDALRTIESAFAGKPTPPLPGTHPAVRLIEAADRRAEAEAAARCIRQMLMEGLRLRDIAVLVRDIDDYHELIDAAFIEHSIPYFADRRRSVTHHPLLELIRAVLTIAQQGWVHESVIALMKTGLAGVDLDDADEVENYVLEHRIEGEGWISPQPWNFHRRLTRRHADDEDERSRERARKAEKVDSIRRGVTSTIQRFLSRLRKAETLTVRVIVQELYQLLQDLDVPKELSRWMEAAQEARQFELRGEHEQMWVELMALFDQLVDLLGDEPLDLPAFVEILESGLEQFDLALAPPTLDQVIVGQVDRTRTSQSRAVLILGLCEGSFPRRLRSDSLLSDTERRLLHEKEIEVDPDSQRKVLDESLLSYFAMTRASERLILLRPTLQDAKPVAPSVYWEQVRSLLPDVPVETADQSESAGNIATPRQLVKGLIRWVRSLHDENQPLTGPWPALYQWLASYTCCDDHIDLMRYRAWRALGYANVSALSPAIARSLFPSPLVASVSQIESFAACPFKHFLTYGLRLEERESDDVTAADLGNVYHRVLERVVRNVIKKDHRWEQLSPADTQAMIRTFTKEVGQTLRNEVMLSSARNQYLLDRAERTLDQVVQGQYTILNRGQFRPAFVEVRFAEDGQLPPLRIRTSRGHEVVLNGVIDRIDLIEDRSDAAVIDYKLGGRTLSLEQVYHGLSLQLLTYLLVLEAHGETLAGRKLTPAAAFYVKLLRRLDDVKDPAECPTPDDEQFHLREKPRGIFDGRCLEALDELMINATGSSEVVAAMRKQDGTFGRLGSSDVAETDQFIALLRRVEQLLGQLSDNIISGRIDIAPYRLRQATPCPSCPHRSICRFDPTVNTYNNLPGIKREDVLTIVTGGTADGE